MALVKSLKAYYRMYDTVELSLLSQCSKKITLKYFLLADEENKKMMHMIIAKHDTMSG